MKKTASLIIFIAMTGISRAGDMENAAVSVKLTGLDISAAGNIAVPSPAMKKAASSQSWINAVKKEYEENGLENLNLAKISELPEAAKKQLKKDNHDWGPDYPSVAYKTTIQGKTAYFIHNENDGGMFVNIFDENGKHIAGGSAGESTPFYWSDEKADSRGYVPARVSRRCWDNEKKMLQLTFIGADQLTLKKDGKSCTVYRDKAYPSAHVPQEYQSWFRYYENAVTDQSTHWGLNNPCTKVFGIASDGGDLWGVFTELRLDSNLSKPLFNESAQLRVQMIGDGAGPARANYICR